MNHEPCHETDLIPLPQVSPAEDLWLLMCIPASKVLDMASKERLVCIVKEERLVAVLRMAKECECSTQTATALLLYIPAGNERLVAALCIAQECECSTQTASALLRKKLFVEGALEKQKKIEYGKFYKVDFLCSRSKNTLQRN
jgi:hypothetical protein